MYNKKTFFDGWEISEEDIAEDTSEKKTASAGKTGKYYRSTMSLGKKGRLTVTYRENGPSEKDLRKATFKIFDDGACVYGYSELVFS